MSYQFTKDSFGSIASDRIPKSLPHNNPYATRGIVHLVCQKIEEGGRNPPTVMFDDLNVPVAAQKNISSLRFQCHWEEGVSSPHPIRS